MTEFLCQIKTAKFGLVPETKCGKVSTTQRATSWTRDVTCPDCLEQTRLDRIKVDAANAVGKSDVDGA